MKNIFNFFYKYYIFFNKKYIVLIQVLVLCNICFIKAQNALTEQEAIAIALKNHPALLKNKSKIEQAKLLLPTAKMRPFSEFTIETPQYLLGPDNVTIWSNLGFQQSFTPSKVYKQNEKVLQQNLKVVQAEQALTEQDIRFKTQILYQNCLFTKLKTQYAVQQDSLFKDIVRIVAVEQRVGNINALEKLTMESFYQNIQHILRGSQLEENNALILLAQYLNIPQVAVNQSFIKLETPQKLIEKVQPIEQYYAEMQVLQKEKLSQQKLAKTPTYTIGANQYILNRYIPPIVRVGVAVPLWKSGLTAQNQVAEKEIEIVQNDLQNTHFQLVSDMTKALTEVQAAAQNLDYYEKTGLPQANEITLSAQKIYVTGSITAYEYLQSIKQAFELKMGYLLALKNYNEAVIRFNYFNN
jgi:outer membrane protein, heavy metal efflux system